MPPNARRNDLDRLRILACLSTFAFHAMAVFDHNPDYHVKSNTSSDSLDVALHVLHLVRLPLFFLLAGMVGFIMLRRYSNGEVIRQRAVRLLPPFFVGIILITPAIKYLELLDGRNYTLHGAMPMPRASVPDIGLFLKRYYTQVRWFSWSHMWFPLYLLLLSVILLPAQRAIANATWRPSSPLWLVLGVLGALIAIELVLRPFFPRYIPNLLWDWANVATYSVLLLAGAALVRWPELELTLQDQVPLLLACAAIGVLIYFNAPHWPTGGFGRALATCGMLGALIGIGPMLARGLSNGEAYLSEAALPLYVLHHLPVVAIAFLVKDMPWPIWQRYSIILFGALMVALAAYHVLVRPFAVTRRAFGMPVLPHGHPSKAPVPAS